MGWGPGWARPGGCGWLLAPHAALGGQIPLGKGGLVWHRLPWGFLWSPSRPVLEEGAWESRPCGLCLSSEPPQPVPCPCHTPGAPGRAFNPFPVSCRSPRAAVPDPRGCSTHSPSLGQGRGGRGRGGRGGRGGVQRAAGAEATLATTNRCDSAPEHLAASGNEPGEPVSRSRSAEASRSPRQRELPCTDPRHRARGGWSSSAPISRAPAGLSVPGSLVV